MSRCGKNLLDPDEIVIGGIAGGNGLDWATDTNLRTGYIPINPNTVYSVLPGSLILNKIHAYDKDKKWIALLSSAMPVKTPDNTAFLRMTFKSDTITNFTDKDLVDFKTDKLQLELGNIASEYEPYIEPVTSNADSEGNITGLVSVSPNMTLTSDTENVIIECEYNRDLMKVIEELTQAIISLGGNI